jgi:hypothetical protein
MLAFGLAAPAAAGGGTTPTVTPPTVKRVWNPVQPSRAPGHFARTAPGRTIATRGYLPMFERSRSASAGAGSGSNGGQLEPAAPSALRSWDGQMDLGATPPDTTGAAGEQSYVQAINRRFAIYSRTGTLMASLGFKKFVQAPDSFNTDPQVVWDPATGVFYYALFNYNNNYLYYGWSRTGNPASLGSSDWCHEVTTIYGASSQVPDYPKLGGTAYFGAIGVNVFNAYTGAYMRSDVFLFQKQARGTTDDCPPTNPGPQIWQVQDLTDGTGGTPTKAFTPIPAAQTDFDAAAGTGTIVAATPNLATPTNALCGNELTEFTVTGTTTPSLSAPTNITVPEFDLPDPAPQYRSTRLLDTLDCRLTQAVSGFDPNVSSPGPVGEVWTQHTVLGGPGAAVRWYELGPASIDQSGTVVGASSTFAFNGAISSDRSVPQSGAAQFGGAMVLGFNTSSTTQDADIRMVSKVGAAAQSKWLTLKVSPGPDRDYGCGSEIPLVCRWGDYAGAGADPRTSAGPNGHVWLASQWNVDSATKDDVDARTFIWEARP